MKRNILYWSFFILLLNLFVNNLKAQSTAGRDFWITFLPNYSDNEGGLSLVATGNNRCTGTVTNPYTGWSTTFDVNPGRITTIDIPDSQAYDYYASNCVINKGLHITSTNFISLYASNFEYGSFDITNVLPTASLGSSYIVQTYPRASNFSIVAIEDSTIVNIQLPQDTIFNHANTTFTITLNEGQCYQAGGNDLSGTTISTTDDKTIAVFAGNSSVTIPSGKTAFDYTFEQMIPTKYLGNRFIITNSKSRENDIVRVTALFDNCRIKKDGELLTTINANESYEFEITKNTPAIYLETSAPASVFLYLTGKNYGGENGDPSMVLINDIDQRIVNTTFKTFYTQLSQHHFVNITTKTNNITNIQLDGNNISSHFTPVPSKPDFSYARIEINYGAHSINDTSTSSDNGFIAHVYGLGPGESYAYSTGSMIIKTLPKLLVNDIYTVDYPNGFKTCSSGDISFTFDISTNYIPSNVVWNFGDGTTATGFPITHQYNDFGTYNVSCDIYIMNYLDTTLSTIISINPTYDTTITATICQSEVYNDNGFNENESGIYINTLKTTEGCDSIIRLNLTVNPEYDDTIFATIREGEYYNKYGFYECMEGVYSKYLSTHLGCDSSLHLFLNIDFDASLFVENCITPNASSNNKFHIFHDKTLIVDDVYIYNRVGSLIFHSPNNSEPWNGKYNGEHCPQGTYAYVIYYHKEGQKELKVKTGTVLLLY
ncbi:MAG: gliding motility-associated C-terminal domain-containing protein [Bacteroidales bacterium]|nr:gliding motility-associated C-terminal domain-containing protein [Bacteroidales bacterium]